MVKIPTATRPPEPPHPAGPPLPPSPDAVADVQQDAEDGETVSMIVPDGVKDHAHTGADTDVAGLASALDAATSVTHTSTEDATPQEEPRPTAGASPAPPGDDRQSFKVVLRLKPVADNRWHATIGIGRDGCDPCWEGSDVDDWPEALDAVLGVHAAAEARWAEQPRNPRPAVPGASGSVTAASVPVAAGSTPTKGRAKGKDGATSKAPPSSPPPTAAASAPPPTAAPAPLPPPVPPAGPAPTTGVEKLTLF